MHAAVKDGRIAEDAEHFANRSPLVDLLLEKGLDINQKNKVAFSVLF